MKHTLSSARPGQIVGAPGGHVGHRGQAFVLHHHRLGAILRGGARFTDHHRHRVAHEAHAVGGEDAVIAARHRRSVAPGAGDHGLDHAEPVRLGIRAGEHGDHAGQGGGGAGVDAEDVGMGVRGAQHDHVGGMGQGGVVGVAAEAAQQAQILHAPDRGADPLALAVLLHRIRHLSLPGLRRSVACAGGQGNRGGEVGIAPFGMLRHHKQAAEKLDRSV